MIFSFILRTLRKEKHQGFSHLFTPELEKQFKEDALKVFEDELGWARYLMSFGEIPGMSERGVEDFLKYYIDDRLVKCGSEKIFNAEKSDLVKEFIDMKDINNTNSSLQETSNISYNKGGMVYDTRNQIINDLDLEIAQIFNKVSSR